VTRVAEKERISALASTGLYYFSSAREFATAGDSIIAERQKTRDEYFVIPVYQHLIEKGARVGTSEALEVWDMGNPTALEEFTAHLGRSSV
jgi:dTDP-glucose pyrophosphorylase